MVLCISETLNGDPCGNHALALGCYCRVHDHTSISTDDNDFDDDMSVVSWTTSEGSVLSSANSESSDVSWTTSESSYESQSSSSASTDDNDSMDVDCETYNSRKRRFVIEASIESGNDKKRAKLYDYHFMEVDSEPIC